jgi:hypothetical protein
MTSLTRRWCLLAIAGAPIVLGISAQALSVRLDDRSLHVTAPSVHFLRDEPLKRLTDGRTVGYLGQLTISTGNERIVQARSLVHFAFSYDIWTERFKVTVLTSGAKQPSAANLTKEAAEAWCLDQLNIDLTRVPADRQIFIRLEIRSEDQKDSDNIIGEPGINLSGLIAVFSHPPRDKQVVHVTEEIGPMKLADLRKPRT